MPLNWSSALRGKENKLTKIAHPDSFEDTYSYHYFHRKRGSASYIVREVLSVRERERERDTERERERETEVTSPLSLKLAINLQFPLPKIRTIGDDLLTLSLAKNLHFPFLPSHFPSLPSRRGHHGGAEIRNEFTLSIAKNFFALSLCFPSMFPVLDRFWSTRHQYGTEVFLGNRPLLLRESKPVLHGEF